VHGGGGGRGGGGKGHHLPPVAGQGRPAAGRDRGGEGATARAGRPVGPGGPGDAARRHVPGDRRPAAGPAGRAAAGGGGEGPAAEWAGYWGRGGAAPGT